MTPYVKQGVPKQVLRVALERTEANASAVLEWKAGSETAKSSSHGHGEHHVDSLS
jgi:hypothetical protein